MIPDPNRCDHGGTVPSGPTGETSKPGCLLTLVLVLGSVVITIVMCFKVGTPLFVWIVSTLPEEFLKYIPLLLAIGAIVYGTSIAPGLLFAWLVEKLNSPVDVPACLDADQ